MRNGLARFKEEFPSDNIEISLALGNAIRGDNQHILNQLITTHFSRPETRVFLDGAIAVYIDDNEEVHIHPPAILAVMSGSRNALLAILKATHNPNARKNPDAPKNSPTLLMQAILNSDIDMVKLLLEEGADVNDEWVTINEEGEKNSPWSALFCAVHEGLTKTANLLLDNGAVPTITTARTSNLIEKNGGLNPLLVKMIELRPELLHDHERTSGAGIESWSLLHYAAVAENLPTVKWLLEHGAIVNSVSNDGSTPFDFADEHANKEIAEFLQSVGGESGKREGATELQNPSATKQEITKNVERLELLEEKFGIAMSGLYASYRYDADYVCAHRVTINFDLVSLSGSQLERSFKVIASAYNAAGQLLETGTTYIDADDFMGFSPTTITLALDQMPEKIRLFPANP